MSIAFDIGRTGALIRPAEDSDAKAVRMLLPHVPDGGPRLVAVDPTHQLVIGAAAATIAQRTVPRPGPGVAVHVIPPCRRCGVGKALMQALLDQCAATGAQALYSINRVDLDTPEMSAWEWLGFSVCETVQEHELPIEEVERRLGPVLERLRNAGSVPEHARIIPLYAAEPEAVARLHLTNLGGDRASLLARLTGKAADAFHPRYSLVLTLGGGVVGCLLGHRDTRETFVIDAVIVDPALRHGWANLWLKLEATRRVRPERATHIRYTTFDRYANTRRFTENLGGVTTRKTALMHRKI